MTLLTTEPLFWHCGAHTAEPEIGLIRPIPPIPYYQNLLFSVARGRRCELTALRSHESRPRVTLVGSVAPCTQAIDAVITQLQSQKTYTSRQRYLDVVTAQAAARILLCCAAHPHLTSSVFAFASMLSCAHDPAVYDERTDCCCAGWCT